MHPPRIKKEFNRLGLAPPQIEGGDGNMRRFEAAEVLRTVFFAVMWLEFLPELELELIQFHMTQKPMLWGEVDARALGV